MAYTLIILLKCSSKYNILFIGVFAEEMWVGFAFAKATHISSAKTRMDKILYLLEQLTFWPLKISLG